MVAGKIRPQVDKSESSDITSNYKYRDDREIE